jgi:hypothetical protein
LKVIAFDLFKSKNKNLQPPRARTKTFNLSKNKNKNLQLSNEKKKTFNK